MEMRSSEKHKALTYSENACHTCESVQKRNRGVTNFVVLYRVSTKSSEFSGVKLSVELFFQLVQVSLGLPRPGRRQKRNMYTLKFPVCQGPLTCSGWALDSDRMRSNAYNSKCTPRPTKTSKFTSVKLVVALNLAPSCN